MLLIGGRGDVDPVEMQRERDLLAIEGSAQFG
jgi:hypothetical protein